MKLYHATWTKSVSRIQKRGLLALQTSNWTNYLGERKGGGAIYAFVEKSDAIRWAAKMEWEYGKSTRERITSIVTIEAGSPD